MLKIGITGEMGSGKTYISNLFAAKDVPIYNCDKASKNLVKNNEDLKADIKKHFGEKIYEGNVFKNLSEMVFTSDKNSASNLKVLSDLIHPYIYKDIDDFCAAHPKSIYCLIESAILYENKMEKKLDSVIYVNTTKEIRKRRAIERDGITPEEYDNRMKTQLSPDVKSSLSDYIVFNNGANDMKTRVDIIHDSITWNYVHDSY